MGAKLKFERRPVVVDFADTLRALQMDRSRRALVVCAITAGLAIGWFGWMTSAEVPLYRTSVRARLEVLPGPSRVVSVVAARVIANHLQLGARVGKGDVLLELDAQMERLALDRARAQLAALDPELVSLDRELALDTDAVTAGGSEARSALREQLARQSAAEAAVEHAERELARAASAVSAGVAAAAELDQARADLAQKRAARVALVHAGEALAAAQSERDAGRRSLSAALERQRAELAEKAALLRSDVARLEVEVERRVVRAPVSGVVGSALPIQPGAFVAAGDIVATVVPDGTLRVGAEFSPTAIGLIAPGQRGRLRLDGFPWTRWGSVDVKVTSVSSEVHDGTVRVELEVAPGARIPLAHGMTGTVDVEVDRLSPGALVLRSLVDHRTDDR